MNKGEDFVVNKGKRHAKKKKGLTRAVSFVMIKNGIYSSGALFTASFFFRRASAVRNV